MAVGTLALLYVVPVFFMFFQRLHERFQGKSMPSEEIVETQNLASPASNAADN
jgi:hypothetical protein